VHLERNVALREGLRHPPFRRPLEIPRYIDQIASASRNAPARSNSSSIEGRNIITRSWPPSVSCFRSMGHHETDSTRSSSPAAFTWRRSRSRRHTSREGSPSRTGSATRRFSVWNLRGRRWPGVPPHADGGDALPRLTPGCRSRPRSRSRNPGPDLLLRATIVRRRDLALARAGARGAAQDALPALARRGHPLDEMAPVRRFISRPEHCSSRMGWRCKAPTRLSA